jgi:TM2 domain-containing membrane protein YozV
MTCANHPDREAAFACGECGKRLCAECAVQIGDMVWCKNCLEGLLSWAQSPHHHWTARKLIAALLSLIPGAGHMFLGLIGKGFALMGLLFAAVFLVILYSDSTGMYWLAAYLIPAISVLFLSYAVFDSMAVADAEKSGQNRGDDTMESIWERVLTNRRTIGWVVLVAGIVGVLNIFSAPIAFFTETYLSMDIPFAGLVLPVILLIVGANLLRKGGKKG